MRKSHFYLFTAIISSFLFFTNYPVLFAQAVNIKGRVIEATNEEPFIGANVVIKGSKSGTITNNKGEFEISAQVGDVLVISSVGHAKIEVKIRSEAALKIIITKKSEELEDVVVTALGMKRDKKALGYSATVINNEELTDAVSANWTDALSGKVAGLNLIRSNGGPTGSNKIILRGENNLTGENEALIVVDGVVINQGSGRRTAIGGEDIYGTGSDNMPVDYGSSINDLNPEDIESVTVLKGPGAAALYGQRGANGAIIIVTKSGASKNKGLGINLKSSYNGESVNRWPALQYEYGQGLGGSDFYQYGLNANGSNYSTSSAYGPRFDGQMFYQYNPATQIADTVKTLWKPYPNMGKDFFESGNTFTNDVTLSGGTKGSSAKITFSTLQNDWIIPNTGYKRNSIGLSLQNKVNDYLQISSKVTYTKKWSDNLPGAGYGNQSLMYWYIFWQPNADVNWLRDYWVKGQEGKVIKYPFSSFPENPYAISYEFINKTNRQSITGNFQATITFTKALSLMARVSSDLGYEQRSQQRPFDAGTRYRLGSYRTQNIFSQESSADYMLTFNKKLSKQFHFTANYGGSTLVNTYNRDEVRADSLEVAGVFSLSNAKGTLVTLPYKSKYVINSQYGLISTSFNEKIFADITLRYDWNSVLATPLRTSNSGFFYPSLNFSILMDKLVQMPKYINFAKLRLSIAGVGSGGTTPYLTSYTYRSPGAGYSGALENPTTLPNYDLKPLKTTTYEAGLELKAFKSRVDIDIAVYTGTTNDQILNRIIDRSSGYARAVINGGAVQNQGFELSVQTKNIVSKDGVSWNTKLVFSTNKNKIISLPDSALVLQTGRIANGQIIAAIGGSMGDMYGRGYVRAPDGQVVYDAVTGVALINPELIYIGNTIPKFKMGIQNEFLYKSFRVKFLFDGQYGAVAHSLTNYKMVEQGKLKSTLPGRYNGIIGKGVVLTQEGKYVPNTTVATDIDNYYRSHMGADNAEGSTFRTDFIKFREANIEFSIPKKLCKKIGVQKIAVGIYGRNLMIWSGWPAFDPEFGTLSGTDIVQGFEIAQFPSTRSFGCNISCSF